MRLTVCVSTSLRKSQNSHIAYQCWIYAPWYEELSPIELDNFCIRPAFLRRQQGFDFFAFHAMLDESDNTSLVDGQDALLLILELAI